MDKIKNFFTSKSYKWILWIAAEIFLLALVFALGMRVGLYKAKYSYDWGKNYERNFMGHHGEYMGPGMIPPMGPDGPMDFFKGHRKDFRNGHGVAGEIVSIADNSIVIKDRDNKENTVSVSNRTVIKSRRDDVQISDLKVGQKIVIIGKPGDNGTINAELIRVFNNDMFVPDFAPANQ